MDSPVAYDSPHQPCWRRTFWVTAPQGNLRVKGKREHILQEEPRKEKLQMTYSPV